MISRDRELAGAYQRCRELHRRHGRTYYLATRLLPAWKRRHVHALYGFARYADDLVDGPGAPRADQLRAWSGRFLAGLAGEPVDDPLLPAVLHTIAVFDLDHADFAAFLDSMAMDLTVTGYTRYGDLLDYMAGSAAAVGTLMLPILGTTGRTIQDRRASRAAAQEPARQLGIAFQLTNFIRDVAEDLGRGRLYLPQEDLDRFGLSRQDLVAAAVAGRHGGPATGPRLRALIEYEVARARRHYAAAAPGLALLESSSRACVRTAFHLYAGILDEVARAGYDVFSRRATVPTRRRLAVAARCLLPPVTADAG